MSSFIIDGSVPTTLVIYLIVDPFTKYSTSHVVFVVHPKLSLHYVSSFSGHESPPLGREVFRRRGVELEVRKVDTLPWLYIVSQHTPFTLVLSFP